MIDGTRQLSIPFRIPAATINSNENVYIINFQFLSGFQIRFETTETDARFTAFQFLSGFQ